MAIALKEYFDVSLVNLRISESGKPVQEKEVHRKNMRGRFTEEGLKLKDKPFRFSPVGMMYALPAGFPMLKTLPHKLRIGFTMFETDKLPTGDNGYNGPTGNSADPINKMDVLFVPCEHNRELFRNSGVNIPIEVIHLGYDQSMYFDMTAKRKERRKKSDVFTFLMTGTLTIRKNPGAVITAFMELFKDRKDVKLIMKTQSGTLGHFTFPKDKYNIEIIDEYYTPEQMQDLYAEADCFVFPSKGEGFGLPPLEAMATGLYSIFPNHTGLAEFANEEFNGVIKNYKLERAVRYPAPFGDVGNWYTPDYAEFRELMRQAEENREKTYELGEKSVAYANKFTYKNTAKMIYNAIKKYYHD